MIAQEEKRKILPGSLAAREIAESQSRFERGDATVTLEELLARAQLRVAITEAFEEAKAVYTVESPASLEK